MRSVRNDDILLSRLKLMVIMARAYLQEASLGKTSIRSIIRNAGHLSHLLMDWNVHLNKLQINPQAQKNIDIDHIFYQRIKLLAIMVKSIAQGNPLGTRRRVALQNNLDYISEILPHLQPLHQTVLTVVK
jgi:hypothetical protein